MGLGFRAVVPGKYALKFFCDKVYLIYAYDSFVLQKTIQKTFYLVPFV